jgi:ribose 5-phosphate isomerase A
MNKIEQDKLKQMVSEAALQYIPENTIIGVGTGSTVDFFIDALARRSHSIKGTVASSKATEAKLKSLKIPVFDLNTVDEVSIYMDGADACNHLKEMVKGGGGALTREKILCLAAKKFICLIDESKLVKVLGEFPVAVEVIPMARSLVAREIVKLGGYPVYREHFITDNGNLILDVHNWVIAEPIKLERQLNNIPGIVCNGIFAEKNADIVLIATENGLKIL